MTHQFRWINTGYSVFGLEDAPRHFRGYVSLASGGVWTWYVTGGPSFSESRSWEPGIRFVMCGECPTRRAAMREVEGIIYAIHRYCRKTTFGRHPFAVFEFEAGEPVVRAVGTAKHCERYLRPGGLIVDVGRYRQTDPATA